MAPEIPAAIYKLGATTLPVCPTCQSFGTYPASTAALLAPIAAPSLSANFSRTLKFSLDPRPLPPETTISAAVNSGLSDLESSELIYFDNSELVAGSNGRISLSSLFNSAFSKAVVLTVITLQLSLLLYVAIALPA